MVEGITPARLRHLRALLREALETWPVAPGGDPPRFDDEGVLVLDTSREDHMVVGAWVLKMLQQRPALAD